MSHQLPSYSGFEAEDTTGQQTRIKATIVPSLTSAVVAQFACIYAAAEGGATEVGTVPIEITSAPELVKVLIGDLDGMVVETDCNHRITFTWTRKKQDRLMLSFADAGSESAEVEIGFNERYGLLDAALHRIANVPPVKRDVRDVIATIRAMA